MYKHFFKRLIDFVLSLIAVIIIFPFMLPIIIGLLATGEHYVFYFQKRMGYKNSKFSIWKFATMLKNSPNMGTGSLTLRNDPRVLPMGGFLRKTKINELPQLMNILLGQMSIVGPRPLMQVDFEKFPQEIQEKIYDSKPGVTGIGSIVFRDEEKFFSESGMDPHEFDRKVVAPYKGALELWYKQKQSFIVDFKIIFLTAWVILFPESTLMEKWFKDLPERPDELR